MAYTTRGPSIFKRNNFRRIISQLDRARTDAKILKIVNQASNWLTENDVDWDAVNIRIPAGYKLRSERRAAAKVATAVHPKTNGGYPLGGDGRLLLKKAITQHAGWPTVRDTLSLNSSQMTVEELISVAQLLGIDAKFVAMFQQLPVQQNMFEKDDIDKMLDEHAKYTDNPVE